MSPWRALGCHLHQPPALLALPSSCLNASPVPGGSTMDRENQAPSPGRGGRVVWAQEVRGAPWKRRPLLGLKVREAGICQKGLWGVGG